MVEDLKEKHLLHRQKLKSIHHFFLELMIGPAVTLLHRCVSNLIILIHGLMPVDGTITSFVPPATKDDWAAIQCMLVSRLMNTIDSEVKSLLSNYDNAK